MDLVLVVDAYKEPKSLIRTCIRKGFELTKESETEIEEQKLLAALGRYIKENNLGFPLDDAGIPIYYAVKLFSDDGVEIIKERD